MSGLKPLMRETREAVLKGAARAKDRLHQVADNMNDHVDDVARRVRAQDKFDDKPSLLSAMKEKLGSKATTVFVRQGHYADEADLANLSGIDISIASIAELAQMPCSRFLSPSSSATASRAPIPMEAS